MYHIFAIQLMLRASCCIVIFGARIITEAILTSECSFHDGSSRFYSAAAAFADGCATKTAISARHQSIVLDDGILQSANWTKEGD